MDDALTRLRRWVAEQEKAGRSRTQIAASLSLSEGAICRYVAGNRTPGGRAAAAIERATEGWDGGPIRTVDWYPDLSATG